MDILWYNMSQLKRGNHYVKKLNRDESKIIIIDDDPKVLHNIKDNNDDIILLKDTSLVD